jgi:hypothetical protein
MKCRTCVNLITRLLKRKKLMITFTEKIFTKKMNAISFWQSGFSENIYK